MSYTYQEGFKNAAGDTWACTPSLATKEGNKYVYSGALTPAQVNSPDFNVTFAGTAGSNGAVVDLSNIRVKIIYTMPLNSSTRIGRGPTSFADVAYGPGTTAVICGAKGLIQRSTDNGVSWSSVSSGTPATLRSIKWDGSQFIAAGDAGVIITSPDGLVWTSRNSGVSSSIMDIGLVGGIGKLIVGAQNIGMFSLGGVNWR